MDGRISVCKYDCVIMDNDTKEVKEKLDDFQSNGGKIVYLKA